MQVSAQGVLGPSTTGQEVQGTLQAERTLSLGLEPVTLPSRLATLAVRLCMWTSPSKQLTVYKHSHMHEYTLSMPQFTLLSLPRGRDLRAVNKKGPRQRQLLPTPRHMIFNGTRGHILRPPLN